MGVTPKAALIIGVDPILAYTCQVQVHDQTNDWEVAGGLRGEPIELVKSQDLRHRGAGDRRSGDRVRSRHGQDRDGGPARRIPGYYTPASLEPLARVTAITHRNKPVFQGLLTGKPVTENHILKQISIPGVVPQDAEAPVPDHREHIGARLGRGVVLCRDLDEPALRRRSAAGDPGGDARTTSGRNGCVIVDPNVDVRNSSAEVEWAMAFRTQPQRDVTTSSINSGRPLRSLDRRSDQAAAVPHGVVDRRRRHQAVPQTVSEVADVPGWEDFDMPELDGHAERAVTDARRTHARLARWAHLPPLPCASPPRTRSPDTSVGFVLPKRSPPKGPGLPRICKFQTLMLERAHASLSRLRMVATLSGCRYADIVSHRDGGRNHITELLNAVRSPAGDALAPTRGSCL